MKVLTVTTHCPVPACLSADAFKSWSVTVITVTKHVISSAHKLSSRKFSQYVK